MTVPPPNGAGQKPSADKQKQPPTEEQLETARRHGRFLGWVILALIVAYGATLMPLPYKLFSPAAGLVGVVLAVVLLIKVIRARSGVLMIFSSVVAIVGCTMFTFMGTVQAIFWDDTVAFDQCISNSVTERSLERCAEDLEQGMISRIPGGGAFSQP